MFKNKNINFFLKIRQNTILNIFFNIIYCFNRLILGFYKTKSLYWIMYIKFYNFIWGLITHENAIILYCFSIYEYNLFLLKIINQLRKNYFYFSNIKIDFFSFINFSK